MAGRKPVFITGANAKVKLGGRTFAYASDVSYNVTVDVIPVETMGRYEAVTQEPVNYSVSGSLSVVRYTSVAGAATMPGTVTTGNGLGHVASTSLDTMSNHLNPGNLLLSQTWDLAVFQKTQAVATVGAVAGAAASAATTNDSVEFITIKDCRFISKQSSLTKRGIMVDQLSFVGILADDDSFDSSGSGDVDFAL